MKLKVFGKDGVYLEIEIDKFEAASSVGKYEVLKNHAPFVADVVPCKVSYEVKGKKMDFYTAGGLVKFDGENLDMWVVGFYQTKEEFEKIIPDLNKELQPIARAVLEE